MLPNIPILEPPQTQTAIVLQILDNKPKEDKPKAEHYTVKRGDKLIKIAERLNVPWKRLYYANKGIQHPDKIKPGMRLRIPLKDEKLKARKIPAIIRSTFQTSVSQANSPRISGGYSSSGNTYFAGQCVWGVKNWVSWVPNGWGSAYQWVGNARAQGHLVDSNPRVGDVASSNIYNHVAVVIGVGKGTVTTREMNYSGPFIVTVRTSPRSEWQYIHP